MGFNDFDKSGVMDLTRNIMIMSIIGLFIVMIFAILVHFFAKRSLQRALEEYNNQMQSCEQKGLDASFLKTIRVVEFDPKEFKEGLECAVCLSDVEKGEKMRILPKCDHGFHVECIDMWFHAHTTCPICRNSINDQTEVSLQEEESINVLVEGDEVNNHPEGQSQGQDHGQGEASSSSEQGLPSSSSSLEAYKNRGRPDLVIDIPWEEGKDEKTPGSCSGMRSLKRILSGTNTRFNPFSPGSSTGAS